MSKRVNSLFSIKITGKKREVFDSDNVVDVLTLLILFLRNYSSYIFFCYFYFDCIFSTLFFGIMIKFLKLSLFNSYKLESLNKLTIIGNMNRNDLNQSIDDGWYFFC